MIRKCLWSLVIVNITIDSILSVLSILCLISHIQTSDVVRQGHITARVDWRTDGLPGLEAIVGVALIMIRIKNKILKDYIPNKCLDQNGPQNIFGYTYIVGCRPNSKPSVTFIHRKLDDPRFNAHHFVAIFSETRIGIVREASKLKKQTSEQFPAFSHEWYPP